MRSYLIALKKRWRTEHLTSSGLASEEDHQIIKVIIIPHSSQKVPLNNDGI